MKIVENQINLYYIKEIIEEALNLEESVWEYQITSKGVTELDITITLEDSQRVQLEITELSAIIYFEKNKKEINIVIEENEIYFETDFRDYLITQLKLAQ